MVRQDPTFVINGIDVDELRGYIESCRLDTSAADRNPTVSARWVGGSRAEVTSSLGGAPVYMARLRPRSCCAGTSTADDRQFQSLSRRRA